MKKLMLVGLLCFTLMMSLVGCSFNFSLGSSHSKEYTYYDEKFDAEQSKMANKQGTINKEDAYYIEYKKYFDSVRNYFEDKKVYYFLNEINQGSIQFDEPISISSLNAYDKEGNSANPSGLNSMYYDLVTDDEGNASNIIFNIEFLVEGEKFEDTHGLISGIKDVIGVNGATVEKIVGDINTHYENSDETSSFFYEDENKPSVLEYTTIKGNSVDYTIIFELNEN